MATKDELYGRATELEVEGRSDMNKAELEAAIAEAEGSDEGKAPEEVSGNLAEDGGEVPADGKIIAPMEDPVGTVVTHREELAEQVSGKTEEERVEAAEEAREADEESGDYTGAEVAARAQEGLSGYTTTINGERAASGDPAVTHAEIFKNRADTDAAVEEFDSQ